MEYAFGDQVLDVDRCELRRDGERVALQPQVFDLLVYLVLNRDRVVSKDDLLGAVWGGRIVSEFDADQPDQCRTQSDWRQWRGSAADPNFRPKRGPLHRCRARRAETHGTARCPTDDYRGGVPTRAHAPRQAIDCRLALCQLSGGPEQEYFADGMVEEIITALSRIRWLFVIARNSCSPTKVSRSM